MDRGNPCHVYMIAGDPANNHPYTSDAYINGREAYPYLVERGDLTPSGMSWTQTFTAPTQLEDNLPVSNAVNGKPAFATLANGSPGSVWLAAPPNASLSGVHVFSSKDLGADWQERDNGLGVHPQDNSTRLVFAPSSSRVAYIVSSQENPGTNGEFQDVWVDTVLTKAPVMHATVDGGQSWATEVLPAAPSGEISPDTTQLFAVDPVDPAKLYYITLDAPVTPSTASDWTLWESSNGGSTWTPTSNPVTSTIGAGPARLLVTHRRGGTPTLYVELDGPASAATTNVPAAWYRSQDDGVTWRALPLPVTQVTESGAAGGGVSFLVPDPNNPDVLVWASVSPDPSGQEPTHLVLAATTDGFRGGRLGLLLVSASPGNVIWADSLQTDDQGDFFLALRSSEPPDPGGPLDPRKADSSAQVFAFRPSALTGGTITLGPSGTRPPPPLWHTINPGGPNGQGGTYPYEPQAGPPLGQCQLTAGPSGVMAFDGRYVDVSNDTPPPGGSAQVPQGSGVIERFDSACRAAPPLDLRPADFPGGRVPPLVSLTYAATYRLPSGTEGAILASGPTQFDPRVASTNAPIYAIDPQTGASLLLTSVDVTSTDSTAFCNTTSPTSNFGVGVGPQPGGNPLDTTNGVGVAYATCGAVSFFSYDVFRSGLWSTGTENPADPNHINMGPGFLTFDGTWQRFTCLPDDPIASTIGGDGYLYVQAEDDKTIYKIDWRHCAIVGGFSHPDNGENQGETEQIACDPLSFSEPAIWTRDSTSGIISAYPAPDAACPFPTQLTYAGPSSAKVGAATDLCFVLSGSTDGRWNGLPGEPVTIQVNGSDIGQATTDQSGRACLPAKAPAGGVIPVRARFAGTDAWLPSAAEASLLVIGAPTSHPLVGVLLPPILGGIPLPLPVTQPVTVPGGAPAPEPVPAGATNAEAQAQAQAQAQTQSVSQTQPGVAVQRQRRIQVATQEQGVETNTAYNASGLRRGGPAPLLALIGGTWMFGLALVRRRPRLARARARTRARGGRRA